MTDTKKIMAQLDKFDRDYAEHWALESMNWYKEGIYQGLAKHITLAPGQIHVDFGCGLGLFIHELHKKEKNAYILGSDVNARMISLAGQTYKTQGVDFDIFHQVWIGSYKNFIHTCYTNEKMKEKQLQDATAVIYKTFVDNQYKGKKKKGITFIADDYGSNFALEKVLGKRKINSASIMFSGTYTRQLYEFPYPWEKISDTDANSRTQECIFQKQKALFMWLNGHMEKDGKVYLIERSPYQPEEDLRALLYLSLIKHFGEEIFDEWYLESALHSLTIPLEKVRNENLAWVGADITNHHSCQITVSILTKK